jgi:hypothetical protein
MIIIVSHNSSREHRAFTKIRHLTRFLASTLTSFHVLPWSLISSKIVLRHVLRGLPRDLVPWGFHSKAAFAMSPGGRRSVWPSHVGCVLCVRINFAPAVFRIITDAHKFQFWFVVLSKPNKWLYWKVTDAFSENDVIYISYTISQQC